MIETRSPTWWLLSVLLLGCVHAGAEAQVRPAPEPPKPQPLVEAIVYTTLSPPNLDLYLFEEPGGDARRLTDDPAKDYNAVFSPDGRWIVFTSERAGPADLYALDLESEGPPLPLTRHAAFDDAAAFSPDGRRLAFVSTREGDADIFVMPFAPGDPSAEKQAVNLTQRPGGDFNPAFSPDGRRIAYSRQDELWSRITAENPRLASAAADLYVMNADGSNTRRVSETGPGLDVGGVEFGRVNGSAWTMCLPGLCAWHHAFSDTVSPVRVSTR
ncbi:MAG TPA: hypothetical protein VMT85_10295 [Thermoanaerobaculia bacterium]|nr:hypothetical protein [Thermoanaerobaculia bacterium]